MRFRDRQDAGRQLANRLLRFGSLHPVILALPRGGVSIGFEIATQLRAPLDVVLVRKLGAPDQPELAIGAIVDGERLDVVLNRELVDAIGVARSYLDQAIANAMAEIERRRRAYLQGRSPVSLRDRVAIVVDDGIATGATMRVALQAVRRRQAAKLIAAVPVAARDTVIDLVNAAHVPPQIETQVPPDST